MRWMELRIFEQLATMRSDCCEEHGSLRSDVLVLKPNHPLLAQIISSLGNPLTVGLPLTSLSCRLAVAGAGGIMTRLLRCP